MRVFLGGWGGRGSFGPLRGGKKITSGIRREPVIPVMGGGASSPRVSSVAISRILKLTRRDRVVRLDWLKQILVVIVKSFVNKCPIFRDLFGVLLELASRYWIFPTYDILPSSLFFLVSIICNTRRDSPVG